MSFLKINTKIFASIYANYFSSQNLANIVVVDFFDPKKSDNDEYTTALYNDFKTAIRGRGVKILNLKDSSINSIESIRSKYPQTQAILAISNGEKNSATIALAKENDKMNSKVSTDRQIQLFTTHAMGDRETLSKIKESSVAVKIVGPCQNNNSPYINVAKTNWNQEDIDWRTAYSYDSTQRIIQAIESLSNPTRQNPTREGILAQFQLARLKSTELPRDKSSGFIRLDRGSLDKNIPVCVLQIEKGKSVDLKE
jgi:ABC-type branched-subunit amino acid transport system substrate-binding protein